MVWRKEELCLPTVNFVEKYCTIKWKQKKPENRFCVNKTQISFGKDGLKSVKRVKKVQNISGWKYFCAKR